tara:strand:- start:109 stop:933 length:825 start_codon:yes stop_codon:yes gene_type:complete
MVIKKKRVLILGASGFLGHSIYKDLSKYYLTYGTYNSNNFKFRSNKKFLKYELENDNIIAVLSSLKPNLIISSLRGPFESQIDCHKLIVEYLNNNKDCKIIFLSSANVFDAYSKFPSYENDATFTNSVYGYFKIKIEYQIQKLDKKQWTIIRLPMVFSSKSHRVSKIKKLYRLNQPIELFPNLVINVCSDIKLVRQLHYLLNRNMFGIFHCGSLDLVHHDFFIKDLIDQIGIKDPKFKFVYTTNKDRYLAVVSKHNMLPSHLQFESQEIINEII